MQRSLPVFLPMQADQISCDLVSLNWFCHVLIYFCAGKCFMFFLLFFFWWGVGGHLMGEGGGGGDKTMILMTSGS